MDCNKCNNPIPVGAKFCDKCGQKVTNRENTPVLEDKKPSHLRIIGSVIGFLIASVLAAYLTGNLSPSTKAEIIDKVIKDAKSSMPLPYKIDEMTTVVAITPESNAVRFHYVLSGPNASSPSEDDLRDYLSSGICQVKDSKKILDQGINLEYSYFIKDTSDSFIISFSQKDCS